MHNFTTYDAPFPVESKMFTFFLVNTEQLKQLQELVIFFNNNLRKQNVYKS